MGNKKLLLITNKFPWPISGATEWDRAEGIRQFLRLGFDLKIITKVHERNIVEVEKMANELGIEIFPSAYTYITKNTFNKILKYFKIFFSNPLLLDGAANEYSDPKLVDTYKKIINEWHPEYIFLDTSYMWPLTKYIKNQNIKVITRSHNYEPEHYLQERGKSKFNLMYLAKLITEKQTVKNSNLLFAITPNDKNTYEKIGAKNIEVLPLRCLPKFLKDNKKIKEEFPLNIFFPGGTYNVDHNKKGLEFILKEIVPQVHKLYPNKFVFNFLGSKFPEEFKKYLNDNTKSLGFVENFETTMADMDIALVPSIFGGGMQLKVFEALVRGIPTITSSRALAGYSFENNKHLLLADTPKDFIQSLDKLQSKDLRASLSKEAMKLSKELFSKEAIDSIINNSFSKL